MMRMNMLSSLVWMKGRINNISRRNLMIQLVLPSSSTTTSSSLSSAASTSASITLSSSSEIFHNHNTQFLKSKKIQKYLQKQDSKGIYRELHKIYHKLFTTTERPTSSDLVAIVNNLCSTNDDKQPINYDLACDILDILSQENSQVTQFGYEKLLDICLLQQHTIQIPTIMKRMSQQGIYISLSKYEMIIKFLLSSGKLSEAVDLISANHLTQTILLAVVEPLFLSGMFNPYFDLLDSYLKKSHVPLDSFEISNILLSIIWAWGRCAPSSSKDSDIVYSRLCETINILQQSHSFNEKIVDDLNLSKQAVYEMLYPSQSFHSSAYVERKAEIALARLRWNFLSSTKYHSFPYLKQQFLFNEDPSLVMQINDLTVQLSNSNETLESNPNYCLQQTINQSSMHRYSNVLLSKSFWPEGYIGELKNLIKHKDESDEPSEEEEDNSDHSDEEIDSDESVFSSETESLQTQDEKRMNETIKALQQVTAVVASLPSPPSSQYHPSSTYDEDSSSDSDNDSDSDSSSDSDMDSDSDDENYLLVISGPELKALEANREVSQYLNYSPPKLRHLEQMHSLGCSTTTIRLLPGLICSDLTTQLNTTYYGINSSPVLFASSLFNEYISHGAPFIGESILDRSALEGMEERFRMFHEDK